MRTKKSEDHAIYHILSNDLLDFNIDNNYNYNPTDFKHHHPGGIKMHHEYNGINASYKFNYSIHSIIAKQYSRSFLLKLSSILLL